MGNHIPLMLTRLICESDDPKATLAEIKRVVEILEEALDAAGAIEAGSRDSKQH